MNVTVKLCLNQFKMANGQVRICLRITTNRLSRLALLPFSILPSNWNEDAEKIIGNTNYIDKKYVQNQIEKSKSELIQLIEKLDRLGELKDMSAQDIKDLFQGKTNRLDFQTYTEQIMNRFKSTGKLGNYTVYNSTLAFVNRINKSKPLYFEGLTYKWLIEAETTFLSQGNGLTTLSIYFRTIRAVINQAIREKVTTNENYPFSVYKIKSGTTKKRAISKHTMDIIETITLSDSKKEEARQLFLLLFYLRGMNFWDLALLKLENISENRIVYVRAKTHKQYSININEKAQNILKPYLEGKKRDQYIFPFVTRTEPELIRKDIENARHTFNKYLDKAGTELKIDAKLTSYVSRHSYATIGKKMGVSMAALSESLGHAELKTTQIYLDSFENDYLDDINKLITG
jgi:site-specific recombinase XerD